VSGGDPADRFATGLRRNYRLEPDQVAPIRTAGYWQALEPCRRRCSAGRDGCGLRHTYCYLDDQRGPNGRWSSPYRTWQAARAAQAQAQAVSEPGSQIAADLEAIASAIYAFGAVEWTVER